ncbi:MAG: NADH-quinone oxidoreductase subunit NuoF [Candidatus Latescibacteria bacterium]|nr:NADH-quinone oxidoreductase subunit NuoF [Candidatus Latescibacterota bacterium]
MDASRCILTREMETIPNLTDIDIYIQHGGYQTVEKALKMMKPEEVVKAVTDSGLKGRGGAGFPTGRKWSLLANRFPRYLCCNADESEPASFKDRKLLEGNPHRVIEGMILTSYANGINLGYIYIRGEFFQIIEQMDRAFAQAYERGYLGKNILGTGFDLDLYTHPGAGAYICGEETGLIESLEGNRPYPRLKPPYFPAAIGLWQAPTIVNNVETMADVALVVEHGADWFKGFGTEDSTGSRLFGLCGHVKKPGLYELESTITLRSLIYDVGGGVRGDKKLKAVIPGGISAPVLTPDELDVTMEFGEMAKAGTMGGTGGVVVMDETVCMVDALLNISMFARHESCGQCTPCREGMPWINDMLRRIEQGHGRQEDIDLLLDVCFNIEGRTVCVFGQAPGVWPTRSFIVKYLPEFQAHIEQHKCVVLPVEESYLRKENVEMLGVGVFRAKNS